MVAKCKSENSKAVKLVFLELLRFMTTICELFVCLNHWYIDILEREEEKKPSKVGRTRIVKDGDYINQATKTKTLIYLLLLN